MATRSIKTKFELEGEATYKKSLQNINSSLSSLALGFAAVTAAVTAVAEGYKKLISMTREMAAEADNILTLSQITGFDTDSIQQLQYASELIDVSFDTIRGSITKLKNNMESARDGSQTLIDQFARLGVSVTDASGNLRDSQEVFYEAIDALGQIENATERDTLAMDLFGKSAQDLNPLIIQGTDTLKKYCEEAENVGYVLGEEQLEALGKVDDAYQRMMQTQEAVKKQIAAEMAPAVEKFYTAWTEFMQKAGQALIDSGIIDNLGDILINIAKLIEKIGTINNKTIPESESALGTLQQALNGVALLIAGIRDTLDALSHLNLHGILSGELGDALGFGYSKGRANNYQTTKMKQEGRYEQYAEYYGLNAAGTSNWRGGYTWVGESGPELVSLPQGTEIMSNQASRGVGDTYNITIDASSVQEFNDIVRIVKGSRVSSRMR